jgi:NitT/TauT family transport system ATP-binding protein
MSVTADAAQIVFDASAAFGRESVFEGLRFDVHRGEFLCILGPSGCGKSTALRMIGGLLPASAGRVTVGGEDAALAWRRIAFVFQAPRLVGWRNARDNVALAMELRDPSIPKATRLERSDALLQRVGLARDAHKFPAMLSGGERQRVAIARALSVDPEIVLMDEPFSALDVNTRRRLRLELVELWRATGKTIIFVTHDIEEALTLADRILVFSAKPTNIMNEITIVEGRPRDLEASAVLAAHRALLISAFDSIDAFAPTMKETA